MKFLSHWMRRLLGRSPIPEDIRQAKALIAAVDAGGIPLNAIRVNQIARDLGLEVSARAPVEQTIERVRAAVARSGF